MTQATARWLAIPEVAERLKIHESTVYRLIEDGHLPAEKIHPDFTRRQALRVRDTDLDAFIRERTGGAA